MIRKASLAIGGLVLLCGALTLPAQAQDTAPANPEIERLKAQLAAQQEQIDQLRRTLDEQKKTLDQASQSQLPNLGQVASTTPVIPVAAEPAIQHPGFAAARTRRR
jgi:uncharacterized coiled-coil protein SlyX